MDVIWTSVVCCRRTILARTTPLVIIIKVTLFITFCRTFSVHISHMFPHFQKCSYHPSGTHIPFDLGQFTSLYHEPNQLSCCLNGFQRTTNTGLGISVTTRLFSTIYLYIYILLRCDFWHVSVSFFERFRREGVLFCGLSLTIVNLLVETWDTVVFLFRAGRLYNFL